MNNKKQILRICFSALCLALCMILPFLTGQIPQVGSALCPMHIPVLICGFWCGPFWGAIVGFVAPLLRSLIFGMPPLIPTGISMAFELLFYGFVAGLLYRTLPKNTLNIYVSLIGAMLTGRAVWGVVRLIISGVVKSEFTFSAFIVGAITSSMPGIVLHIVLIPLIVMVLKKANLIIE